MSWVVRAGEQPPRLFQLLLGPGLTLAAVFGIGVVGYAWIEGWTVLESVWMVGITVSTIGYGEPHPLSSAGRVFTLFLIGVSIFVAARAVTEVATGLGPGGLVGFLRSSRRRRELRMLRGHTMVIGFGRLGREVTQELVHNGHDVVVVDNGALNEVPPEGVRVVLGDATHDAVLLEAGVENARAVAIATPSDAMNVYLTLTIRQLRPDVILVVRVEDEAARPKVVRAGANHVIQPFHMSGGRMAAALLRPGSSDFVDRLLDRRFDDLVIDDLRFHPGSPALMIGGPKGLRERFGVMVVATARAGSRDVALADDARRPASGDTWVLVGPREKVAAALKWAGER